MSRILLRLLVVVGAIVFTLVAAAPKRVPASEKTRTRRYRAPEGCSIDDTCPNHVGTYYFNVLDTHIPPESSLYLREANRPMASRVYTTSDPDGTHISMWQLRTVVIQPEPRGLSARHGSVPEPAPIDYERYVLVPFIFDTIAPHVYSGQRLTKYLLANGALEADVHLGTCNVHLPLPHADVRCIRSLGPSKLVNTNDARKNIIGGAAATSILAVQTAFDQATARLAIACPEGAETESSECGALLSEIATNLIEHDATFTSILRHIIPRDTASQEAITVTINAKRAERRAAMFAGIMQELRMLLEAPRTAVFNEAEFVARFTPNSRQVEADAPPTPTPAPPSPHVVETPEPEVPTAPSSVPEDDLENEEF